MGARAHRRDLCVQPLHGGPPTLCRVAAACLPNGVGDGASVRLGALIARRTTRVDDGPMREVPPGPEFDRLRAEIEARAVEFDRQLLADPRFPVYAVIEPHLPYEALSEIS